MNAVNAIRPADLLYMAPLTVLSVAALLLIVVEAFIRGRQRSWLMPLTITGCAAAALAAVSIYGALEGAQSVSIFGGMLVAD